MINQLPGPCAGIIIGVLTMAPALVVCLCNDRSSDGQSDALIGGSEGAAVHDLGDAA